MPSIKRLLFFGKKKNHTSKFHEFHPGYDDLRHPAAAYPILPNHHPPPPHTLLRTHQHQHQHQHHHQQQQQQQPAFPNQQLFAQPQTTSQCPCQQQQQQQQQYSLQQHQQNQHHHQQQQQIPLQVQMLPPQFNPQAQSLSPIPIQSLHNQAMQQSCQSPQTYNFPQPYVAQPVHVTSATLATPCGCQHCPYKHQHQEAPQQPQPIFQQAHQQQHQQPAPILQQTQHQQPILQQTHHQQTIMQQAHHQQPLMQQPPILHSQAPQQHQQPAFLQQVQQQQQQPIDQIQQHSRHQIQPQQQQMIQTPQPAAYHINTTCHQHEIPLNQPQLHHQQQQHPQQQIYQTSGDFSRYANMQSLIDDSSKSNISGQTKYQEHVYCNQKLSPEKETPVQTLPPYEPPPDYSTYMKQKLEIQHNTNYSESIGYVNLVTSKMQTSTNYSTYGNLGFNKHDSGYTS